MALLLTPRERDVERQKEQERAVIEVSSYARRIDELRELEQTTRRNLQDFQEKEFAKFQEIKEKREEEIRSLDVEVADRKAERIKLEAPLDLKEAWEEVEKTREQNKRWDFSLLGRENNLHEAEDSLSSKQRILKENEEILAEKTSRVDSNLAHSLGKLKEAEDMRARAQQELSTAQEIVREKYEQMDSREESLIAREREAKFQLERNQEEAIRLAKWERELTDKYETLMRTQRRLNQT